MEFGKRSQLEPPEKPPENSRGRRIFSDSGESGKEVRVELRGGGGVQTVRPVFSANVPATFRCSTASLVGLPRSGCFLENLPVGSRARR